MASAGSYPTYASTQVRTDTRGRVTQVVGLDPRTVLLAYFGSKNTTATCDPLEIMDTVPPTREVRVGTFRDPDSPDTVRAISIQRAARTRERLLEVFWPTYTEAEWTALGSSGRRITGDHQYLLSYVTPYDFSWRCDVYANLLAALTGLLDEAKR